MPSDESQPKPEHFLDLIRRQQRGRLKIYLGFAAGVGKTYEMLQEGNRLRRQGVDVVIGFVETHGRAETAAQIGELEQVPRRRIEYHGIVLEEMDLDAVSPAGRPSPWSTSWPTPTPRAAATPSATRTSRRSSGRASTSSPRSTSSTWRACTTSSSGPPACGSRSGCPITSSPWPTRSSTWIFRPKTCANGSRPARSIRPSGSHRPGKLLHPGEADPAARTGHGGDRLPAGPARRRRSSGAARRLRAPSG